METEVTYCVQYQKSGDPTWWEFTNNQYEHKVTGGMHHETYDLAEAITAAQALLTREQYTSKNPKYQDRVVATQVTQRVYSGGTLLSFGQPVTEEKENG